MNNFYVYLTFWNFRRELKYVVIAFLSILLMPVIAVILLTYAGIDIVSDRLATVNESTKIIEILNPANGEVVKQINTTVAWPALGVISLEFGEMSFVEPFHSGIDIASAQGKIGDPVNPIMPGKVIYAGEIWWGYGKHIIIDHGDNITSIYAHLDKIFVYKGQEITDTKQVIGNMGTTGWITGPHLHFQINVYGIPVNPRTFLGNEKP